MENLNIMTDTVTNTDFNWERTIEIVNLDDTSIERLEEIKQSLALQAKRQYEVQEERLQKKLEQIKLAKQNNILT